MCLSLHQRTAHDVAVDRGHTRIAQYLSGGGIPDVSSFIIVGFKWYSSFADSVVISFVGTTTLRLQSSKTITKVLL